MSLLKKIFKSSFWVLLGNSLGRLTILLTNIFAARLLTQDIFGQFTTLRTTVSMIVNIINGALGTVSIKKISESRARKNEQLPLLIVSAFIINIILIILVIIFIFLFSGWIIKSFFLGTPNFKEALYIGIFLLLGSSLSILAQGMIIGFEEFKKFAIICFIAPIISLPVIIYLIKFFGLYGAIWGVSIFYIFDFSLKFLLIYSFIKNLSFKGSITKIYNSSKGILSLSLPLFLSIILNSWAFWYSKIVIIQDSGGFSDIAVFDAAFQWLTIIMILTGATTSVALPMLSNAFGKNDHKRLTKIFYFNLGTNGIISIIIAGIFILFSKNIMLLYGSQYIKGTNILITLSLTAILFSISSLYNKYMVTYNKVWIIFIASLSGVLAMFITLKILIYLSAFGLAWSFFSYYGTTVIVYMLAFYFIKRPGRIDLVK